MGSNAPLLNEYKQEFFWKRFPQTVLGGPKFRLGYPAPCYVYVGQITVFLLPWLLGGMATLLAELDVMVWYTAMYLYGAIMIGFVLTVQCLSWFTQSRRSSVSPLGLQANILAEDDEVVFSSCFGKETMNFVTPLKKFKVNIIIHALISGFMCGAGFWYLLPHTLDSLFASKSATVVIYTLGWFTLSNAQYSLTVTSSPEIATYRDSNRFELESLTRPLYVCLCLAIHILAWYIPEAKEMNSASHIVFVTLPVLWMFGFLPPIDSFSCWLAEQISILLYGGSPMSSYIRLTIIMIASTIIYVTVFFIESQIAQLTILACFGYLLSADLMTLIQIPFTKRSPPTDSVIMILIKWTLKEMHLIMFVVSGISVTMLTYFMDEIPKSTQYSIIQILGYVIAGLTVIQKLTSDVQCVYVMCGFVRNPFYPISTEYIENYTKRKRILHGIGICRKILIDYISPVVMLVYVTMLMQKIPGNSDAAKIFTIFSMQKAFRAIWQCTSDTLLDLSILHLTLELQDQMATAWQNTSSAIQYLIISICRNRSEQIFNKLYFYLTTLVTSWTDKKQRHSSTVPTLVLSVLLCPIVLAIVFVSAVLDAPLLPVFTLPIFIIGFPRPNRFWPAAVGASANKNDDTVYYSNLAHHIKKPLHQAIFSGSLGNVKAGQHFLLRYQDRLVWMFIIEKGCRYCMISLKGLELQETSCHTLEASRIDEILEYTFNKDDISLCCRLNPHPFNTLTPISTITVDTYSDAKNVLTGIIDSPEMLNLISPNFIKSLVWVLVNHSVNCSSMLSNVSKKTGDKAHNESVIFKDNAIAGKTEAGPAIMQSKDVHNQSWLSISSAESEQRYLPKKDAKKIDDEESIWNDSDDNESLMLEEFGTEKNKPKATLLHGRNMVAKDNTGASPVTEMTVLSPYVLQHSVTNKQVVSSGIGSCDSPDDLDDLINDLGMTPVNTNNSNNSKTSKVKSDGAKRESSNTPNTSTYVPVTYVPMTNSTPNTSTYVPVTNLAGSMQFSSPHSSKLSLPLKWREVPIDASVLRDLLCEYPRDWFKYVLTLVQGDSSEEIQADDTLMSIYARLVMSCYAIVNGLGGSRGSNMGPSHVYKIFTGKIPWSSSSDWLTKDSELLALTLKAYRYAVKMSIDQVLLGEASSLDEYEEYLTEYDSNYYIGCEKDKNWKEAIMLDRKQLFSISRDIAKGVYSSRLLTKQNMVISISRLNQEVVRGQWANQNLELLYLTNDDEERYSIQAHPTILRNLTVQSADPPLGYPIYSSLPLNLPDLHSL